MQSPPLHLASHTHYCCNGDVFVAETAVVGAGTVLQALPGSRVQIDSGACIGAGVVIQAKAGPLVVESQASLGTGVLIVGRGRIGRGATVGPASTLIDPAVSPHTVIPPNTLQGAGQGAGPSVPSVADAEQASSFNPHQPSGPQSVPLTPRATTPIEPRPVEPKPVETAYGIYGNRADSNGNSYSTRRETSLATRNSYVYGRDQVNGLLSALFPHRQSLNGQSVNGSGPQSNGPPPAR
ncbi:MAG: hypothetical protein AAFR42_05460 [Cyanobacteria bacterium J06628_6]